MVNTKKLRSKREEKGLTQTELAKRVGMDRFYYTKIESGNIKTPSLRMLERIAEQLGCSINDFF